jgi:hypothetical protein
MTTAVAEKKTEKVKKEKIVRLKPEPEISDIKKRIKDIKTKLMETVGADATREDLDEFCEKMGFNNFFHVRRLVNLEHIQGYVNTNKYLGAITKLNDIVGDLGIKMEKPDRGPRSKSPISSADVRKLLAGEPVWVDGTEYMLVAQ